ncbi:hypothetical protein CLD20_08815 [Afifella sp. IM 167]|nr:hypothetical protein [Afifella sp. IM 167]
MISVVLTQPREAHHLARSLAALVPAAVEGLVRDALVLGDSASEEMLAVTEAAGAEFFAHHQLADAVRTARGDWLLVMEGGARPLDGWMGEVRAFVADADGASAVFTLAGSRLGRLAHYFSRPPALRRGLLIRREEAAEAARSACHIETLARRRGSRRLAARLEPPARA